jgi:hypothetical protein
MSNVHLPNTITFPKWMLPRLKERFTQMAVSPPLMEGIDHNSEELVTMLVPDEVSGVVQAYVVELGTEGIRTAEEADAWLRGGCK